MESDCHSRALSAAPAHTAPRARASAVAAMDIDLLHPDPAEEKAKHKLKRLIQAPNSYFMDVRRHCEG